MWINDLISQKDNPNTGKKSLSSKTKMAITTACAAIAFLTAWCEWKIWEEKSFAKEYDATNKLLQLRESYIKNHPAMVKISFEDIEWYKKFWNELATELLKIPWIEKKVILIDIPSDKWLIVNDVLKTRWFNSTFNLFMNRSWEDDSEEASKLKDSVSYSKLFSVLEMYRPNLNEDNHITTKSEEDKKRIVHTLPWAVIIDKSRLPDQINIDDERFFNNAYTLEEKNLPNFELFSWEDKIREWVVFVSWTDISPDIKEWLDTANLKWIPVNYMAIDDNSNKILTYDWEKWAYVTLNDSKNKYSSISLSNSENHVWWTILSWIILNQMLNWQNSSVVYNEKEKETQNWSTVATRSYAWWGWGYVYRWGWYYPSVKATNVTAKWWWTTSVKSMWGFRGMWWKAWWLW